MPSREVFFSPRSRRDLKALSPRDQESILSDIEALSTQSNLPAPPKVKKLKGIPNLHRLRTGDFRTIFRLESTGIFVLRVIPRKELERTLSHLWA
ncbi:MAG: type II toxin-antitoxin system RelE/ParE family toxin [Elusimicrobia bacterium]|nr:type II toxin-antitoxin system RelE/ParE family toxin [Elusimicrobiota bacterium]